MRATPGRGTAAWVGKQAGIQASPQGPGGSRNMGPGKTRQSGVVGTVASRACAPWSSCSLMSPHQGPQISKLTLSLRDKMLLSLRFSLRFVNAIMKLRRTSLGPIWLKGKKELQDKSGGAGPLLQDRSRGGLYFR